MCVSSLCDDDTVHAVVRWQAECCYDYPDGDGEEGGVCGMCVRWQRVIRRLVGGQLTAVGRD